MTELRLGVQMCPGQMLKIGAGMECVGRPRFRLPTVTQARHKTVAARTRQKRQGESIHYYCQLGEHPALVVRGHCSTVL